MRFNRSLRGLSSTYFIALSTWFESKRIWSWKGWKRVLNSVRLAKEVLCFEQAPKKPASSLPNLRRSLFWTCRTMCKWSGIITNLRIRISGWNLDMERISDLIFSPRGVCVGIIIPEISVSGGGLVIIDNGAEPGWTVAVR